MLSFAVAALMSAWQTGAKDTPLLSHVDIRFGFNQKRHERRCGTRCGSDHWSGLRSVQPHNTAPNGQLDEKKELHVACR
jgi:hypothetical protein